MLKIRLQKIGKKNSPSYRVALVEHTTSPQGKFIELLGTYNPRLKKKSFKKERIEYWLSQGAQPSPTVHNLLVDEKIIEKEKLMAWRAKRREAKSAEVPTDVGTKTKSPEVESSSAPVRASEDKPKAEQVTPEPIKAEEPRAEEPKPESSEVVDK
ncbi:MAG: 30S ribosomal protein S16 [Patescibacteria group bacterium]